MQEREVMNTKQVARALGISERWVRVMARANTIKSHKAFPGAKKYFFYRDELPIVTGAEL